MYSLIRIFSTLLLLLATSASGEDCNTDCHRQCRVKINFPPANFVEPVCHAKCEIAKKAACGIGRSIPNVPLTPREQVERFGPQVCSVPFQTLTNAVIARCSNWDGRLDDQHIIRAATSILTDGRIFSQREFEGVQIRWCPLSGAKGMAPDRGRIYLDVSRKGDDLHSIATLLAHEMMHIRQYRDMGTDSFKCAYSREFTECGGCQDRRHRLERQAYEFEEQVKSQLARAGYPYYFTNSCRHPVRLAIRFKDTDDQWRTAGWWEFQPNERAFLATDGERRIKSRNSVWYFFASTTNDAGLVWEGEHEAMFEGRRLKMKELKDSDGANDWAVTCSS